MTAIIIAAVILVITIVIADYILIRSGSYRESRFNAISNPRIQNAKDDL